MQNKTEFLLQFYMYLWSRFVWYSCMFIDKWIHCSGVFRNRFWRSLGDWFWWVVSFRGTKALHCSRCFGGTGCFDSLRRLCGFWCCRLWFQGMSCWLNNEVENCTCMFIQKFQEFAVLSDMAYEIPSTRLWSSQLLLLCRQLLIKLWTPTNKAYQSSTLTLVL